MNTLHLQDIVKGKYGRKIAYTDVETITQDNVVSGARGRIYLCHAFYHTGIPFYYQWD